MARYTTTTTSEMSITVNSLTELQNLRDLQMKLYLKVDGANNDAQIINLLNLIPTIASKMGVKLAAIPQLLGGYAAEASQTQKDALLTGLNNGYYFFNTQVTQWDSKYRTVKFNAPSSYIIDSQTSDRVRYVRDKGYVVSKTTPDGITITF